MDNLATEWERVHEVLVTRDNLSRDDGYLGVVTTTKSFKISAQSSMVIHGHARVRKGGPGWHCVAEPLNKITLPNGTSLPGNRPQYVTLPPGSQRVGILIENKVRSACNYKKGYSYMVSWWLVMRYQTCYLPVQLY